MAQTMKIKDYIEQRLEDDERLESRPVMHNDWPVQAFELASDTFVGIVYKNGRHVSVSDIETVVVDDRKSTAPSIRIEI